MTKCLLHKDGAPLLFWRSTHLCELAAAKDVMSVLKELTS